MFYIIVLD